ncbi:MAG: FeoA domain-containing protein [Candidatus Bathyarchaeia archaeon]
MNQRTPNRIMSELLELIGISEAKNMPVRIDELALKLGYSKDIIEDHLKFALKEELIEYSDGKYRLTDKGRSEVQKHRESYIHEMYAHRPGLLGRLARLFEGNIEDWRSHWRRRHGIDDKSLKGFYMNIRDLNERVEETSSLADLNQGERGVVAFTLGGYGLVRRLSEMGLTPGTEVKVIRSAPFHGPVEISVRGVSLALGRGVASKIYVRKTGWRN